MRHRAVAGSLTFALQFIARTVAAADELAFHGNFRKFISLQSRWSRAPSAAWRSCHLCHGHRRPTEIKLFIRSGQVLQQGAKSECQAGLLTGRDARTETGVLVAAALIEPQDNPKKIFRITPPSPPPYSNTARESSPIRVAAVEPVFHLLRQRLHSRI